MNRVRNGVGRRAAIVWTVSLSAALLIAAPVFASRVTTDPEPDIDCQAMFGSGLLTSYVTTVETPGDSTDWFVSVEFTLSGADASCELSLSTYELPAAALSYPQAVFDTDGGTFGAGTHSLTAALPLEAGAAGCHGQFDFVFGPSIEQLTFENRYDQRQIRSRIVGSEECPVVTTVVPTPTPTPGPGTAGGNPTPTPGGGTLGGNPAPSPAAALPNTSMPSSGTGALAAILGLLLVGSLGAIRFVGGRQPR